MYVWGQNVLNISINKLYLR